MSFTELLGKKWLRHYSDGTPANEAYLVSHGRYMQLYGFTELASPSDIHFYAFHKDKLFFAEIYQIMNYHETFKVGNIVVGECQPKIATSIMGANATCWNYHLGAHNRAQYDLMLSAWKKGGARNDLLIMEPNKGGFSDVIHGENTSTLNDLFKILGNHNLKYRTIHFLCCRSVLFSGRSKNVDISELVTPSTPYWNKG